MVNYGTVALRAVQTSLTYCVILCVGAMCSLRPRGSPLLDKTLSKQLGALTMTVFMPSLTVISLAENLSLSLAKNGAYVLVIWGCIHIVVNLVVANIVCKVVQPPLWFRKIFVNALTATNGLSLPLIFLEPLCRQSPLSTQTFGEDSSIGCVDRATGFLFIYNIPWMFYLFGYCFYCFSPRSGEADKDGANSISSSLKRILLNHNMVAVYMGCTIGLVAALKDLFFSKDAPLVFVTSTIQTIGSPMVGVLSLLVGSTLGRTAEKYGMMGRGTRTDRTPVDFAAGSEFIAAIDSNPDDEVASIHKFCFVLAKMMLIPAVSIPMVIHLLDLMIPSHMPSEDAKLIRLLLVLECAVPSADTIVAYCLQFGYSRAAECLGQMYLFQYLVGVLSLTVAIGIGHGWAYGDVE